MSDVDSLIQGVLRRDRRSLARALSRVESGGEAARQLLAALYPHGGKAHVIGFTGSPGTGKSTLVSAFTTELRKRGQLVAVLAVDPSSPFTGGAVLGDRIRMSDHTADRGVFIRSMASRGALGGLARATSDAIALMDAAGFDAVLVETVGAGQSEVEIVKEAQTIVVVEVPGLGDEVQAIKAGLLEIADVFAVNKADHPQVHRTARALKMMLDIANVAYDWKPPIVQTIATTGEGVPTLVDEVARHRAYLTESGMLQKRNQARAAEEMARALQRMLMRTLRERVGSAYDETVARVATRELDPHTAAEGLLEAESQVK